MLYWVDDYNLQIYLAERGIKPIAETETTAYYIYTKTFKKAKESYQIERLMQRSHKWG